MEKYITFLISMVAIIAGFAMKQFGVSEPIAMVIACLGGFLVYLFFEKRQK